MMARISTGGRWRFRRAARGWTDECVRPYMIWGLEELRMRGQDGLATAGGTPALQNLYQVL